MATQTVWPEIGVSVDDENGDEIPIGGLTVTWSAYYENLVRKGLIKTFDPTGLNGSPSPVSPSFYDDLAIEYDPDNYTEAAGTVAGHFEGIDDALGALQSDVSDAQADATQALSDAATAQATADATEFRINEQTGTTYTLVAGDFDGRTELRCTHASGCTVTVPSGLSVTAWRPLVIVQVGAAQVTLLESSTTIRRTDSLKTREQWSRIVLETTSTANTFELSGDTESS